MEKFQKLIATIECNHWPVYGLEIRKNGELLHAYGDTKDTRYPIYSATKSFVSTAAGIAVKEGKFLVKESVYAYLKSEVPAYATEEQKDVLKKLTIERLMTMSVKGYPFRPEGDDWLTYSLLYPLTDVEVAEFNYSNIPAYLVGVALEKATGEHLADYLTPRLFEPLGIANPVYGNCPRRTFLRGVSDGANRRGTGQARTVVFKRRHMERRMYFDRRLGEGSHFCEDAVQGRRLRLLYLEV